MSGTQLSPVLHVIVIGFHHKKGCQVEYSYPPLISGKPLDSHEIPTEWKHLPSLALPDGAHNYTKDTTFFHLPAKDGGHHTVYGVACYRQMDAKDLINKTVDVTRSTVQKSVCVLSRLPLYGLIKAKLELITHAYFDERDFSKVGLLEDTYNNLSLSLLDRDGSQIFLGLSARNVVAQFRHKIVMLFKLLLLERRVLFAGTPVEDLSGVLLTVLSLFPGMIEIGLDKSACCGHDKQLSSTLHATNIGEENEVFLEMQYTGESPGNVSSKKLNLVQSHISKKKPATRIHCTGRRSVSHEPESPEIPRDVEIGNLLKYSTKPAKEPDQHNQKFFEICDKLHEKKTLQVKPKENLMLNFIRQTSLCSTESSSFPHRDLQRSISLSNENKNAVNFERKRTLSCNIAECKEQIIVADETEALNLKSITQIEVVQTGQTIQNSDSVINIENYSQEMEFRDDRVQKEEGNQNHLSLNLDDSIDKTIHKTDSIEDLDSPESIIKIDKEDCFSWEEDRLFLKIDAEFESEHTSQNFVGDVDDSRDLEQDYADVKGLANYMSDDNAIDNDDRKDSSTSLGSSTSNQSSNQSTPSKKAILKNKLTSAFGSFSKDKKSKSVSPNPSPSVSPVHSEKISSLLQEDEYGLPMSIFTKGCVCYPYLSLQYLDILQDVNIRSFVIGATNILFKQKRHLTDIIVEFSENRIEFHDRELQKQLQLTTADLRFADILVKTVVDDNTNDILDPTEWEGGDEWLRAQFRMYLLSLLASVQTEDPKVLDDFGLNFVHAWKTTHNYRVWSSTTHPGMQEVLPGHPCAGQISVGDLKVRLAHSMQGTERGKKLNAAVSQTGKYVVQTGKAVSGALNNAKTAVSSWFSSWNSSGDKTRSET